MSDFVENGVEIAKIPQEFQFTEGPVWTKRGSLLFTDIPASKIYEWDGLKLSVFREDSHHANGQTLDKNGNLYTCQHGSRTVTMTHPDGGMSTLASTFNGKKLNSPNDIVVHPHGNLIVFTDPTYGIQPGEEELDHRSVYILYLRSKALIQFYKGKDQPNGLVFSGNGEYLYIADSGAGLLEKFDFNEKSAAAPRWSVPAPCADGIRMDTLGNIWAACKDGVRVYSSDGALLETIEIPEQPANLCFGIDGKTLFVTANHGVYWLQSKVRGLMPGF